MEADPGIDSIKRVEILGAFQNHLPPGVAARIQESTEDFHEAAYTQRLDRRVAEG